MPLVSSRRIFRFVTMSSRRSKLYPTPEDAETAFYEAFERSDLAGMMTVWAEDDDIVCIHPQGPRLTGFDAVRESWVQIFSGGTSRLKLRTVEARSIVGTPDQVKKKLTSLAERHGAEEMVIVTITYDYASRLRSYELIAKEFGLAG